MRKTVLYSRNFSCFIPRLGAFSTSRCSWRVLRRRPLPRPELTPDRAACRAAGAVSLRSTPPFTSFAFAHLRSGPPSYDAEGGTGSGHPATFALTGSISGINRKSVSSLGKKGRLRTKSAIFDSSLDQKGETTITWTADRRGPERLLLPFRRGPGRHKATPACATRTRPIASQAPPSRGWHVALCRPVPLLPTHTAVWAACRAAGAVSAGGKNRPLTKPSAFFSVKEGVATG